MGYLTNCMPEDPHSFRDSKILLSIGCCFIPVKSFHNLPFFADLLERPWTTNDPKTSLDLRKRHRIWPPTEGKTSRLQEVVTSPFVTSQMAEFQCYYGISSLFFF